MSECGEERILELIRIMEPEKREALLERLEFEAEAGKERSVDEWEQIWNDREKENAVRRRIHKAAVRYGAKIRMITHYVQSFETLRPPEIWGARSWQENEENWAPYYPLVAKRLELPEECVLDLCALFFYHFIPMAEKSLDLSFSELLDRMNKDWKDDQLLFQICSVKDLAKLYMLQRLHMKSDVFKDPWYGQEERTLWRELLAKEDIGESMRKRMCFGVWEELKPKVKMEELRCSMHCTSVAADRREPVGKAFEMLEKGSTYQEVMDQTGLMFEEVRALDCFTLRRGEKEK